MAGRLGVGLHFHMVPPPRQDLLLKLRGVIKFAVVMEYNGGDADYYIPLMDDGEMLWVIRPYHPNVMSHSAQEWAGSIVLAYNKWRDWFVSHGRTVRLVMQICNELELDVETGGQSFDNDFGFVTRRKWMTEVGFWLTKAGVPWAGPWASPGHNDIDGRQEIRQLGEMFRTATAFGGHYYGSDNGGYDAVDREWFSDRVLKVKAVLNEMGYGELPILIGETNVRNVHEFGPLGTLQQFRRYCERIREYVKGIAWFVWSSGDPGFGTMQLYRLFDSNLVGGDLYARENLDEFTSICRESWGGTDVVPPVEPPEQPGDKTLVPETVAYSVSGQRVPLSDLVARYGFSIELPVNPRTYVAELHEVTGVVELQVTYPVGFTASLNTEDGRNPGGPGKEPQTISAILGRSSMTPKGQGFWVAECEGTKVRHLGLLDGTNHDHVNIVFARVPSGSVPTPPQPEPTQDPGSNTKYQPEGGFKDHYQVSWGRATGPAHYAEDYSGPPEYNLAAQHFENGTAVWTGSSVQFIKRGT